MRREASGLARSTLEIVKYTERLGHQVCLRQPHDGMPIWGSGDVEKTDLHSIHSQIHPDTYADGKPKIMFAHGEPLSSVGNTISMRAIVDLAPLLECMICLRKEEQSIWNSIKRTYYVPKGVDLQVYCPQEDVGERLSGEPAVLYIESWRNQRNPLYLCKAMEIVHRTLPKARLHLYNVQDQKMHATFKALIDHCKWSTFIRSLQGPVADVVPIMNKVDIVVSALYPLYARTPLESLACGKAAICAGYNEPGYPWTVEEYSPEAFAETILNCWNDYNKINYRQWAEQKHDAQEMMKEVLSIYARYL